MRPRLRAEARLSHAVAEASSNSALPEPQSRLRARVPLARRAHSSPGVRAHALSCSRCRRPGSPWTAARSQCAGFVAPVWCRNTLRWPRSPRPPCAQPPHPRAERQQCRREVARSRAPQQWRGRTLGRSRRGKAFFSSIWTVFPASVSSTASTTRSICVVPMTLRPCRPGAALSPCGTQPANAPAAGRQPLRSAARGGGGSTETGLGRASTGDQQLLALVLAPENDGVHSRLARVFLQRAAATQ